MDTPPTASQPSQEYDQMVTTTSTRTDVDMVFTKGKTSVEMNSAMTAKADKFSTEITQVIQQAYKDLSPASQVTEVANTVVDMVVEAMDILHKYVILHKNHEEALKKMFASFEVLAADIKRAESTKKNDAVQENIVRALVSHKAQLRTQINKLSGYIDKTDLARIDGAVARFEQINFGDKS